jgi:tetratricopeptide (TPR) repeat protein
MRFPNIFQRSEDKSSKEQASLASLAASAAPAPRLKPLGGVEAENLKEQVKQGNLTGLRAYLARTRAESAWHDRIFMLQLVAPNIRLAALNFACEAEPEAADLSVIRCAFYTDLARTMRGSGTCDDVTRESFGNSADCVKAALAALETCAKLDAQDPTAFAYILPCLTIFDALARQQQHAFQQATALAPDLVPAYYAITNRLSKRWGGGHEESLEFARKAITKAGPGSDMAFCLFWAHKLVSTHAADFDKKPEATKVYRSNPEVLRELEAAFDAWTNPPYTANRWSITYLHEAAYWFYRAGDRDRAKRAISLTDNTFSEAVWGSGEDGKKWYAKVVAFANSHPEPSQIEQIEVGQACFEIITDSLSSIDNGDLARAERSLGIVLQLAQAAPPERGVRLVPLALLSMGWLKQKLKRADEAARLRAQALRLLDAIKPDTPPIESGTYSYLMAHVFDRLEEYRRAIPFWEQAIRLMAEDITDLKMANMLHLLGNCYRRIGLRDHSAIALRASYKIFATYPEDPRLPNVLIDMGSALMNNSPAEAEAFYKQAAEIYSAKMQYQSATIAWGNLGILFSKQERYAESLEYHQKTLRVREQTAGTPPSSIARTLNNIANTYRRMGNFAEAHASIKRAMDLHTPKDATFPNACNTLGLIYLDSGDNLRAVEWLRKSTAEFEKQPSPSLEAMAENLEKEMIALKALGREEEVGTAEQKLARLRATLESFAQAEAGPTAGKTQLPGAVLIELPFGNRSGNPRTREDTTSLVESLDQIVRERQAGYYSNSISVAESTTLIFYAPDAEVLFKALEPSLGSEPVCAGSRVVIRQGSTHREVIVPSQVAQLV